MEEFEELMDFLNTDFNSKGELKKMASRVYRMLKSVHERRYSVNGIKVLKKNGMYNFNLTLWRPFVVLHCDLCSYMPARYNEEQIRNLEITIKSINQ